MSDWGIYFAGYRVNAAGRDYLPGCAIPESDLKGTHIYSDQVRGFELKG